MLVLVARWSYIWVALALGPKILRDGCDLWVVFCHSMNAGSVVGIPWGGGDTQTLPYAKEFVLKNCTQRQQGCKNFRHKCSCHCSRRSHLVKLSLTIFVHMVMNKPERVASLPKASLQNKNVVPALYGDAAVTWGVDINATSLVHYIYLKNNAKRYVSSRNGVPCALVPMYINQLGKFTKFSHYWKLMGKFPVTWSLLTWH